MREIIIIKKFLSCGLFVGDDETFKFDSGYTKKDPKAFEAQMVTFFIRLSVTLC